jgi:hypothetical protein
MAGTPGAADIGSMEIRMTATDKSGEAASDVFLIHISDASTVNQAHTGTPGKDDIITGFANDFIEAGAADDEVHSGAGRDVILGGYGSDRIFGGFGNDWLLGQQGHDFLDGGAGDDAIVGGEGHDRIVTGEGNNLVAGGAGHDTISSGSGQDVILMNLNDGKDVLLLSGAAHGEEDDAISLGGGISAGDLYLRRKADDLILEAGNGDEEKAQLTLAGWYADADRQSVTTLQLINDGTAVLYDFKALVSLFDADTEGASSAAPRGVIDWLPQVELERADQPIGGAVALGYANEGAMLMGARPAFEPITVLADPDAASPPLHAGSYGATGIDAAQYAGITRQHFDSSHPVTSLLDQYLSDDVRFDFEILARELDRSGTMQKRLGVLKIARRWRTIAGFTNDLQDDMDQGLRGAGVPDFYERSAANRHLMGPGGAYSVFSAGAANLRALKGLEEGLNSSRI